MKALVSHNVKSTFILVIKRENTGTSADYDGYEWMGQFAKYQPRVIDQFFKVGKEELWNYTNSTNKEVGTEENRIVKSSNKKANEHDFVDLSKIIQSFGGNRKIRIQILDENAEEEEEEEDVKDQGQLSVPDFDVENISPSLERYLQS